MNCGEGLHLNAAIFQRVEDPLRRALVYMERHQILSLFQDLCTMVFYAKPEDPKQYMMSMIQDRIRERGEELELSLSSLSLVGDAETTSDEESSLEFSSSSDDYFVDDDSRHSD